MATTGEWWTAGACLSADPDLFFPISDEGPGRTQVRVAKEVCGRCPVREACLRYALDTRQAHGVWGGTDPAQRRALTRRAARRRPGTARVRPPRGGR
ncbi:MAG: WhiB family transcriptional regulator [Nonomuraea sp.]|nr:WhiB family transcriptional regulator [Nonomuraea sp.]